MSLPVNLVYLARAASKRAAKLEEEVDVLGVDDMGFGFNGRERPCALTVDEGSKGKDRLYLGLHLVSASCPGLIAR